MNRSIVKYILLKVLAIEGACMMLPAIVSLFYQEREGVIYLVVGAISVVIGILTTRKTPEKTSFYAKEGLLIVGLSWILLTLVGAIPFFVSREIPHYVDAITLSFGTAGTGGFGVLNDGIAPYPLACQITITVFMLLFGINFSLYYLLLTRKVKEFFKSEELRWYLAIVLGATLLITWNIIGIYQNVGTALHEASFHVASIITTTGYSIADFNLWPGLSHAILVLLMFIGACAGSTGGGLKVSRIILSMKIIKNEVRRMLYPNRFKVIKMDGHTVPTETVNGVKAYMVVFFAIFGVSMLIGRLEIYPILAIFAPVAWRKNKFTMR